MKKLGFIGGGNMAEALMRGLIETRMFAPADLIASDVDPARRLKIKRKLKIDTTADNREILRAARAILFAVKPQNINEVLDELARAFAAPATVAHAARGARPARPIALKDRLFISIAAGITLGRFMAALGDRARVVRVMPNAPAMVGQGMAALVRAPGASKADEAFALRIFRAVGDAVAIEDERLLVDLRTVLPEEEPLLVKALLSVGAKRT